MIVKLPLLTMQTSQSAFTAALPCKDNVKLTAVDIMFTVMDNVNMSQVSES